MSGWLTLTKQKICWIIIKKHTEKSIDSFFKKGIFKSFRGQSKVNNSTWNEWISNKFKRWISI